MKATTWVQTIKAALLTLQTIKQLAIPIDNINVNGGACGGRLALTVVRELQRRNLHYGLATLCLGGGEAVAVIFERVLNLF